MNRIIKNAVILILFQTSFLSGNLFAATHVFEIVEKTFIASGTYKNPYTEVDLWVNLTGPGGTYRIPAFWDGGNTFRVRLVATEPGTWKWSTGSNTGDRGLDSKEGSFQAVPWTDEEKDENPNRRGFIRVASNDHTLEYPDGTPFFYTGDTWWSALTKIYAWDSDECPAGISFQNAIALRKSQGFNGINMIACFPSDALNGIWDESSHGMKVAPDGSKPFEISDPNDPDHGVDYTRINPKYWQQADIKMQHLWDVGFIPFMESVRRHEQWYSENDPERKAFVNYVRYLWARYGCYNLIFSWVHWDWKIEVLNDWKSMVNMAFNALGEMPYGQPRTAMAWGSSLTTWLVEPGAVSPGAFDIHNVSNKNRNYIMHGWLRDIFNNNDPRPGINIEPFYPGWGKSSQHLAVGLDDCAMAQFQMYGSVLNGGFAGHAWGDTYYAGVATSPSNNRGDIIPAGDPHRNGLNRWCAATMGILKDFILDSGHDYRIVQPAVTHLADTLGEWRALALSEDFSVGLGFIAANHAKTIIRDIIPDTRYRIEWWNIDYGGWSNTSYCITDTSGNMIMPSKPNSKGWAFRIQKVSADRKYKADWESLKKHKAPDWFLDAKFGIYCHWGPYSVPAFKNEWYSHWMYVDGHPVREYHEKTYGTLDKFGYKDFIPMFTAEKFDPEEWADLFYKAGAKFAGPVTEHADGFAMWDSKTTKWNAAGMGPKQDIVGKLASAIRKRDMKFVATFHHSWNFAWYPTWDETTDASNPEFEDLYGPKVSGPEAFKYARTDPKYFPEEKFVNFWHDKIIEVIDNYEPDLIYFDGKLNLIPEQKRMDFLSYYYNHASRMGKEVVCTYKFEEMAKGAAVIDLERARMNEKKDFPWLTDDSIDWGSWCYVNDHNFKSTNRLIDYLIDVVSKNGCVMLNITPKANGEIPEEVKEKLLGMGNWLRVNGEAIYETRPWKVYGEGPTEVVEGHLNEHKNPDNTEEDIRFTTKDDIVYAIVMDTPTKDVLVKSLGNEAALLGKEISSIDLLGSTEKIKWEMSDKYLKISVPETAPCKYAVTYKIVVKK